MTPELLAMLTPEEREAWALCERASPAPRWDRSWDEQPYSRDGYKRSKFAIGPQYGVPAHPNTPGDKERGDDVAAKVYADAAWMQNARTSLPLALTTIATLRAEHAAYRANADDLFQEMRVRGEALQRDLRDAEPAASVEASEADRLRAEVATLRETLAEQQRAFVIGLDLAQRTAGAEVAELRATLDNERGEGAGPSEGWTWNGACDAWYLRKGVIAAAVERWTPSKELPYWTMATDADYGREIRYQSARAAMKAADDAVKGAT